MKIVFQNSIARLQFLCHIMGIKIAQGNTSVFVFKSASLALEEVPTCI